MEYGYKRYVISRFTQKNLPCNAALSLPLPTSWLTNVSIQDYPGSHLLKMVEEQYLPTLPTTTWTFYEK